MTEREIFVLKNRLIPQVSDVVFHDGDDFKLVDKCRVVVASADENAAAVVRKLAADFWSCVPEIVVAPADGEVTGDEAYELTVVANEVKISAATVRGVRYAMFTLRQLAEPERNVREFSCHILPQCRIKDAPAMSFRGVHICWFRESGVWQLEKQIRLAAYYKFNHIVLECWGTFPYKATPELCWPGSEPNRAKLDHLLEVAKELGVVMIPQLNLLGHGSASRTSTGKHVFLYRRPELQSLMEPDGWAWCLTNPETRKMLTAAALELFEAFGRPKYFHIGCDEAYNMGSCASCRRQNVAELVGGHLRYFHGLFARQGARVIMWHDMLLTMDDERFKNYIVCGAPIDKLSDLYKTLPRDIVIADWQYGYPEEKGQEPQWPTSLFFKDAGFDVLVCPWLEPRGTGSLGKFAAAEKLMGMLATTWHHVSGHEMQGIYLRGAYAAWNGRPFDRPWNDVHSSCNFHIRQIALDMNCSDYEQSGTSMLQIDKVGIPG